MGESLHELAAKELVINCVFCQLNWFVCQFHLNITMIFEYNAPASSEHLKKCQIR